jgi:photosystem II stability/assembly factor-like uncharacterized protein
MEQTMITHALQAGTRRGFLALLTLLAVDPRSPSTLYVGTFEDGAFKTTDAGQNWRRIDEGLTDPHVLSLAIDPTASDTVYAGTWYGPFKSMGGVVSKSTDGGVTWTPLDLGLPQADVRVLVLHPTRSSTVYAATTNGGVFITNDGGSHWSPPNQGLLDLQVFALAISPANPARLYAGTYGNGVYALEVAE